MTHHDQLDSLIAALAVVEDLSPTIGRTPPAGAVFIGSGDSLSSALLGVASGHRALSSGDLTWTGRPPVGAHTVVGISHSGTSGATVRALRLAREHGSRVIAITSNPESPLAGEADELQLVPTLAVDEVIPSAGHLMLGLGVAAVCGVPVAGAAAELSAALAAYRPVLEDAVAELPDAAPTAISVLSLPGLNGAADFWALKLIEATGLSVRTVALEESGHVDYFIGPQSHLTLQLVGATGAARFVRLAAALEHAGQVVQPVRIDPLVSSDPPRGELLTELAGAALGAAVAAGAASRWGRPPFRGGAVNMDARHIKLDEQPVPGS